MRQVGTLSNETEAQRFAAWLVAQRVEAHTEQENGAWVIWVRDEDQLKKARQDLTEFQKNPADAKYQGVERTAEAVAREAEEKRRQAQKNVVEMRGRWGAAGGMAGMTRRSPVVMLLIGLSAVTALLTYDDTFKDPPRQPFGAIYRGLLFADPVAARAEDGRPDIWANIKRVEVWRLVTPIFIHYGWMHILMNMYWLNVFGSAVENRRGSRFLLLLVLAIAVLSNVGQAVEASVREAGFGFGGMSGVGFGLFGYMLTKAKFDDRERYFLNPATTFVLLLWFVLCILSEIPPFRELLQHTIHDIANTAHAVGLIAGAAIAYVSVVVRKAA
jgi:GlpG protein